MNYPSIRFRQENGEQFPDYELFQLGDIYSERNEKGDDSLPILTISIHSGVSDGEADEDEIGKRVSRSEDKSLYKRVYEGDLAFNMMRAWQGAIGVVRSSGMISPAYIAAIPNEKVYPPYMNYYMRTDQMIHNIDRQSYGLTDFRKRLYWDSFAKISCYLPCLEEQKKIADFLDLLVERIDEEKEILSLMVERRKELLRQIMPQEISLSAENVSPSNWEEYRFGDLVSLSKEKAKPGERHLSKCIELENIDQANGTINGFADAANQSSVKNIFHAGDVLFGKLRPYLRKYWLANFEGVCSSEIWVLKPDQEYLSSEYLFHYVGSDSFIEIANISSGTKMPRADWKLVSSSTILLPPLEEQKRITDFLSLLNEEIDNKRGLLADWESLKNGLLQRMFV